MGETLGISSNIWEKKEREKDRKERMKAIEEWNREKKQVYSLHGGQALVRVLKSLFGQEEGVLVIK